MQPIFHRCWGFALGVMQILAFLHTNMLVYPMQNCGVGGLSQCEDPTRMVLCCSRIWASQLSFIAAGLLKVGDSW